MNMPVQQCLKSFRKGEEERASDGWMDGWMDGWKSEKQVESRGNYGELVVRHFDIHTLKHKHIALGDSSAVSAQPASVQLCRA